MDHDVPICFARTKECTLGSCIVEGRWPIFSFKAKFGTMLLFYSCFSGIISWAELSNTRSSLTVSESKLIRRPKKDKTDEYKFIEQASRCLRVEGEHHLKLE